MDAHASRSRPLISRNHYRKRPQTHLCSRHSFAKTRIKQAIDRPIPMEIDEWVSIAGNINAAIKHSRSTEASKFGGSPLNWRRNSAIHFGVRPAWNNISPSCHQAVNSRPNFHNRGRTRRRKNNEYSTERDGEIEKMTSDDSFRKAALPLKVYRQPVINPRFTCMRRWDECTQSEASCPPTPAGKFSASFHGFDYESGDDCESMDIDTEYITNDGGHVYRTLLQDIEERLGDLDVYTADDVSEHCTRPLKSLCL